MPAKKKAKPKSSQLNEQQNRAENPLRETLSRIETVIRNTPTETQSPDRKDLIRRPGTACRLLDGSTAAQDVEHRFQDTVLAEHAARQSTQMLEQICDASRAAAPQQRIVHARTGREQLRKTGIELIADTPWGMHFCQFYRTKEDLIDILVPYFKAGLENNEFCMWVTSGSLDVEDANRALKKKVKNLDEYIKKGQLRILDHSRWYTTSGHFQLDKVLQRWVEKEKQALEEGFDGLRVAGNTFWLEKRDWRNFTDYEAVVSNLISKHRMLAVCTYCLDKCTASEIIEIVSNHQFALVKQDGKWRCIESSERKRAEREIAELAKFPEENPNPVLRISRQGTVLYSNRASSPLLNLWQCRDGLPLSGHGYQCVLNALDDGLPRQAEVRCDSRIFSLTFAPIVDCDYVNVYALDITMHKRAERKIRELNEELEKLAKFPFENPFPVLRIARNGNILYSNAPALPLLKQWNRRGGEPVPEHWSKAVAEALDSNRNKITELECDGRIISFVIAPVTENGYVNVYGHDVTEARRAGRKVRELNEKLEKRVAERTARLTRAHKQLLEEIEERKCLEKELLNISEREQRLIGQELHDSVGQQFAGIAFMAKVLEQKLASKLPDEAANAAEIAKLVNQATDQARDLAKGLHPVDLDAGSLLPALRELAAATEHLFGIHCTLKADENFPMGDTSVATHLYRITQEAITNAIKHSRAKNIRIALTAGSDKSVLTVESDGLDFPEVVVKGTGMGLQIMDHRAEMIHGSLNICRSDHNGTILTCVFPNKKQ